jgi:hypothetical protein
LPGADACRIVGWQGVSVSRQLINEYRTDLDRLRAVSGSRREGVLSEAFKGTAAS